MIPRSTRIAAFSSALALTALSLVVLPAVSLAPAAPALADSPSCIEGFADYPNLKGLPHHSNTDTEVNGYFAGNFTTASGASEMEGKFVIGGAANYNSGAYFNIGSVGAGSQVTPPAMSDMLITGGNVVVGALPNEIEVGNLIGGNIVAGGTVGPLPQISTNGGTITQNAAAPLAPYAAIPTGYQALSTTLDALADTGTVTNDAGNVYFDGNGTDTRQVFTVAGSVLGSIGATKSMVFTNIPTNAVVIINVTGATAVVSANVFSFSTNGTPGATINPMAAEPDRVFSRFTQSLMWNFTSATTVTLGDQDQLLGSILVPTAGSALQLYTSTNGRIFVNGDVRLGGGAQTGLEIHNYPFRDACAVVTGSLSITKSLSDPADVVSDARHFTGTYSCVDAVPTVVASGTWSVIAGATQTVNSIPTGATCTITEDTLSAPPHPTDTSYVWGSPTYSPTSQTIGAGTTVNITATNSFTRSTGSFAITKSLTDPDSVVASGRTFTGTYSCTPLSGSAITGSWSVTAGATQTVTSIPTGSTCSIAEDALTVAPSSTDPSYIWGAPTFFPATVTTTSGTVTITATNTVTQGTGSFTIDKTLTDPDSVVATGRTFTGTYSCTTGGAPVTGSWSVTATSTQTISGIPAGASCSITEDALTVAPSSTDPSYAWGAPTYSPSTVGITNGGNVTITATNTVLQGSASLSVRKVLTDPDSVVTPGRLFTGTISCDAGTPSPNTWGVTAGGAAFTFTGIPAGATCTIAEDALTVRPSATDSSYYWEPSTFLTPATVTLPSGSTAVVQVLNQVSRGLGHIDLVKVLDDPFSVVSLTRVYTGTFDCTHLSASVASGPWSTTAGAAAITLATNLPAGTVCTVAEDAATLAAPPLAGAPQYIWRAPSYAPTTITIADGVTGRFTVTNTVYDPFDLLAATGTDAALPLSIGGGLLGVGLLIAVIGYRRRRSA
jgi:choice-of-anchor A domain-containing protein